MKFDYVIGNPPYQETLGQTEKQNQSNSTWIYQYFQFEADKIGKHSCLIYPFGGWFDTPKALNGLGNMILSDKHTIFIHAYEGTLDKRAWYRNDKQPNPIFGNNANLSAGVAVVYRDENIHDEFEYSNRIYTDLSVNIKVNKEINVTPNPLFTKINEKLGKDRLINRLKKGVFDIESTFVEENPDKVSFNPDDWQNPIQLLTNDKSGSSGRAKWYWTDKTNIPNNIEFIDYYKVIITSAYPKKSIVSGAPTISNVKDRINKLVEIAKPKTAFGKSRMALFITSDEQECNNFMKYINTDFFAGLILQEPNRRSTIGDIIPNQDFSNTSDIHWNKSIKEIDDELFSKYKLSKDEINFIKTFEIKEELGE